MTQTNNNNFFTKLTSICMDLLVIQLVVNGLIYVGTSVYKQYTGEEVYREDYDDFYD